METFQNVGLFDGLEIYHKQLFRLFNSLLFATSQTLEMTLVQNIHLSQISYFDLFSRNRYYLNR